MKQITQSKIITPVAQRKYTTIGATIKLTTGVINMTLVVDDLPNISNSEKIEDQVSEWKNDFYDLPYMLVNKDGMWKVDEKTFVSLEFHHNMLR